MFFLIFIVLFLAMSALAGWLAGIIMKSKGGMIRNTLLGIGGGLIGGIIGNILGIESYGFITSMLTTVAGACILVFIVNKLFH